MKSATFICGCGHTGTTLLARILGSHPGVFCPEYETNAFLTIEGVQALPGLIAQAEGRHFVEKTPQHIHRMGLIRQAFPQARFLLTVRDGRHVSASFIRRCGSAEAGAERWVTDTEIVKQESGKADVTVVRYEDLIADPISEIQRVCEFTGIPFDPVMLDYHKNPVQWYGVDPDPNGTHEQRRAWQVNQPIFDGRGEAVSVPILESGAGKQLMEHFGYG